MILVGAEKFRLTLGELQGQTLAVEIDRAGARKGSFLMTHTLVDDPGGAGTIQTLGELQGQTLAGEIDRASARKGTLVDDPGGS